LSASNYVVSAVQVQEKEEEGKFKQIPVYFASEALSGSKLFCCELEKIAYEVVMAVRKLRHYLKGRSIRVITKQPLNDLFTNKETYTQIIKWGAELSKYTVDFEKKRNKIANLGRFCCRLDSTNSQSWRRNACTLGSAM
jgi:hypothetical protein